MYDDWVFPKQTAYTFKSYPTNMSKTNTEFHITQCFYNLVG